MVIARIPESVIADHFKKTSVEPWDREALRTHNRRGTGGDLRGSGTGFGKLGAT